MKDIKMLSEAKSRQKSGKKLILVTTLLLSMVMMVSAQDISITFGAGGVFNINGSPGTDGQVLTSKGPGVNPSWQAVSINENYANTSLSWDDNTVHSGNGFYLHNLNFDSYSMGTTGATGIIMTNNSGTYSSYFGIGEDSGGISLDASSTGGSMGTLGLASSNGNVFITPGTNLQISDGTTNGTSGQVLGSDGSGNVTWTQSAIGGIPLYASTATAAADGGLASGAYFKVSNGDGTSAVHRKD